MAKYGTFKYSYAKYGTAAPLWICVRKQSDLDNDTDLAYINYWDLNRIETRIQELSDMAGLNLSVKTDWQKQTSGNISTNIPNKTHLQRITDNIKVLEKHYSVTREVPDMELLDIYGMNDIESILYDLHIAAKGGNI